MPTTTTTPARRMVGRFRLLNAAADALRHTRHDHDRPVVACPYCDTTIRTRHPGPDTGERGPLHTVLVEHLHHDCPAVQVTR